LLGILPISLLLLGGCGGGGGGSSGGGGGGGGTQACTAVTVTAAQQLQNAVMLLPKDNNGVIVELPAVDAAGAASVSGVLVLGIGTEANNDLAGATQLNGDAGGNISATLNGMTYTQSYLDSGSNANFFPDSSLTSSECFKNQFYCPANTVSESATLQGSNGTMAAADFSVVSANTLFANANFTAFNNLGGPNPTANSVDLGLPFFYGRNVFTGFENAAANTPPYLAYATGTQTIAAAAPNVEPLIVDPGPTALGATATNTPFITINICVPGTSTCQSVDHIEVDTGSVGLRIISSVLTGVQLPLTTNSGQPYAECFQFADGTSWGSLATADIQLPTSGTKISGVNVHLIGDPSVGNPPASCTGTPENDVPTFGANGILGVGPFATDCSNGSCAANNPGASYYSCPVSH